MLLNNLRNILKKYRILLFFIGYFLFLSSWFTDDIALKGYMINSFAKFIRSTSYILFAIQLMIIKREKKEWLIFSFGIILGFSFFIITGEIYLISLSILIMTSIDIKIEQIFKYTLVFLGLLIILVLFLCGFGFLENLITIRGINSDLSPRYALGFYHSNVLPLLFFYLVSYFCIFKNNKINFIHVFIIMAINFSLFLVCNSRISFLATNILIIGAFVITKRKIPEILNKCANLFSNYFILFFTILSFILVLLYSFDIDFVNYLDISLFSGRLSLSYEKIQSLGIHLFTPITYQKYASDLIVVDNAYVSLSIRYSILFMIILSYINYRGVKQYKNNTHYVLTLIIVGLVNFIDNDLLTYSFYPFLLSFFNRYSFYCIDSYEQCNQDDLISIIMSTYNETEEELNLSITSILNQTYSNFEFIIVNDNPANTILRKILYKYEQQDNRIKIIENEKNIGLVNSLNKALQYARGQYIARMDSDDISKKNRLLIQLNYMKEHDYDFIGGYINLIDENNNNLNKVLTFPYTTTSIQREIKFGNCVPHPTWLVKKSVFNELKEYRNILYCEDYDFILRALHHNYKVGNVPEILLDYRIRSTGISKSNKTKQLLSRYYLASHRKKINTISQPNINDYINNTDNDFYCFEKMKYDIKCLISKKDFCKIFYVIFISLNNNYLYYYLIEKIKGFIY